MNCLHGAVEVVKAGDDGDAISEVEIRSMLMPASDRAERGAETQSAADADEALSLPMLWPARSLKPIVVVGPASRAFCASPSGSG